MASPTPPTPPTPPADGWHLPLHHIKGLDLSGDTAQTTGMRRFEAISGATVGSSKLWMGRTHVSPSTASGIHHHGEAETGIYIVSGTPMFTFLNDGEMVEFRTEPGDYIFVPPWIPHQETNPDPEVEAVVVIARSTQEGIVVNVDSFAWRPDQE